jgi:cysteine desulfurase
MSEPIYLDYCATTPVDQRVRQAMQTVLEDGFGNPSSLHAEGRKAAALRERARKQVAQGIGAQPAEIVFTSGATEANNLALHGIMRSNPPGKRHLITSAIEHHAVLHKAEALEASCCQLTVLPVSEDGQVDPRHLRQAMRPETSLVSIMMVNNEMGSIQPIAELACIAHEQGALFHTDAVQAIGTLPVDVHELGVDMLSLSAHKIYGPKGVGALFIRSGLELSPLLFGGPHEGGLRAGTENMPGIVGLGAALELVQEDRQTEALRLASLRAEFIAGLLKACPGAVVHGGKANQAAHIISVAFPGADAELLLFHLDQAGIYASMGSACNAEAIEPSHVLLALGLQETLIGATLRFSLGRPTTRTELERVQELLPEAVRLSLGQEAQPSVRQNE